MQEVAMKRVAFYVRCSTKRQELSNQLRELEEVAKSQGWQVLGCYEDFGRASCFFLVNRLVIPSV